MSKTATRSLTSVTKNGVTSYDARIEQAPVSKDDVEARLKSTSESISQRLEVIQEEIGSTGESIKKFVDEQPLAAVGLALASGLVVGLLASGRRGNSSPVSYAVISGLAGVIADRLEKGADPEEAVESAVRDIEPYLKPPKSQSGGGFVSGITKTVIRAGIAVLLRQGINSFSGSDSDLST